MWGVCLSSKIIEKHRKTSKNTASALTAGAQIRCAKRAMGQKKWVEYFLGLEKIFVPKIFRGQNFFEIENFLRSKKFRGRKFFEVTIFEIGKIDFSRPKMFDFSTKNVRFFRPTFSIFSFSPDFSDFEFSEFEKIFGF